MGHSHRMWTHLHHLHRKLCAMKRSVARRRTNNLLAIKLTSQKKLSMRLYQDQGGDDVSWTLKLSELLSFSERVAVAVAVRA